MKMIRSWLCLFLLLISAHRLPAPISEVTEKILSPGGCYPLRSLTAVELMLPLEAFEFMGAH